MELFVVSCPRIRPGESIRLGDEVRLRLNLLQFLPFLIIIIAIILLKLRKK